MNNNRRSYNELMAQRAQHLQAAQEALDKDDRAGHQAAMDQVRALNERLDDLAELIHEEDRYARLHAPTFGGDMGERDLAEMGRMLCAGEAVKFSVGEILRGAGIGQRNSTTLATGTLVTPAGAGTNIRDGFASQVSSLIDQVSAIDLTGISLYEEPYVVSELEAQCGAVAETAGTARTATDPTFAKAAIKPYEVSVTSFVDKNLGNLNPANYAAKVQAMAMRALRRKINEMIVNGDGQGSPSMFGLTNAKNTAGTAIFAEKALGAAISFDTLDTLVFAYGGDEEVGGNARLVLSKASLKAIGALRGTNEKRRLFKITPDAGNPNTGVIEDGGTIIPYTISSAIGAKLGYGDPANYELGLFGDYLIRVDTSVKSIERMHAILGDVMVGGNLVVDKGFVVGTVSGG